MIGTTMVEPGHAAGVGAGSYRSRDGRERPRVLVIEDDQHDRRIYGMMLCYNGYDLVFAENGASGLEIAQEYDPDLVLLDVGLPDMSGIDVCALLCAAPHPPPVIVLSGFAESRLGDRARAAGCARYVEKPTNPVTVLHHIEALIGMAPLAGVGTRPRVLNEPN